MSLNKKVILTVLPLLSLPVLAQAETLGMGRPTSMVGNACGAIDLESVSLATEDPNFPDRGTALSIIFNNFYGEAIPEGASEPFTVLTCEIHFPIYAVPGLQIIGLAPMFRLAATAPQGSAVQFEVIQGVEQSRAHPRPRPWTRNFYGPLTIENSDLTTQAVWNQEVTGRSDGAPLDYKLVLTLRLPNNTGGFVAGGVAPEGSIFVTGALDSADFGSAHTNDIPKPLKPVTFTGRDGYLPGVYLVNEDGEMWNAAGRPVAPLTDQALLNRLFPERQQASAGGANVGGTNAGGANAGDSQRMQQPSASQPSAQQPPARRRQPTLPAAPARQREASVQTQTVTSRLLIHTRAPQRRKRTTRLRLRRGGSHIVRQ